MKVVILSVSRYDFKTDEGQHLNGAKVSYCGVNKESKENFIGHKPQEATLNIEEFDFLKDKVPCIAEMDADIDMSTKKPTVKVNGFKYISDVNWYAQLGNKPEVAK